MKSNTEPLVVIDKRGANAEVVDPPKIILTDPEPPPTTGDKSEWADVAFIITFLNGPMGTMVSGRAVGLRGDGAPFTCDYILPPIWPKGLDWPEQVKKRLDTFLGCDCDVHGPCAVHKMYLRKWMEADTQRLNLQASLPVSPALEVLMSVEKARASRVVKPLR